MTTANAPAELLAMCRTKAQEAGGGDLYSAKEVEFLRSINNPFALASLSLGQTAWLQALAERERLDFDAIGAAALAVLPSLCRRWLGGGTEHGKEYVVRNPLRADGKPGSFRINLETGRWADFAVEGVKGGDAISLAAYLFHANDQVAAAADLKRMLGL